MLATHLLISAFKSFMEFLCSTAGRELHPCGGAWAGQLIPEVPWSSQDLQKQSSPSARKVWCPCLQQEQWDHAQNLQPLACLIFTAPVGCHNSKYYLRETRVHQMQTVSKELLDVAKTHDKNYLHFMDDVKIILFLKYLEGIPA